MTNQAVQVRTVAEAMEEIRIMEAAENAAKNSDEADLETAGGLIPRGEGQVRDISDPTRLLTIYDNLTGEPRPVPAWTLSGKNSILRRKHEDGTRVFTDKPNTGPWAPGEVPCLLHADHPEREVYRKMGLLNDCPAGSLASLYDQDQHMQRRHRREWATIQAQKAAIREAEDREFRELQVEALIASRPAPATKAKA